MYFSTIAERSAPQTPELTGRVMHVLAFIVMACIRFLFITSDPEVAAFASASGADRIFLDLEIHGKEARQGHLDTVVSRHHLDDVARLRPFVPRGSLLVRINPIHEESEAEIEAVLRGGADVVMLPMFRGPEEVERFATAVGGRARTCLLVETVGAMNSLRECVSVPGIDEAHIGLNDLHLDLGRRFMFEPLAEGLIDGMARTLRDRGVPFGIGGVARAGEGLLPAELLLGEHVRLGSTGAILSRTFHRRSLTVADIEAQMDFALELRHLRSAYAQHLLADASTLDELHCEVQRRIRKIVDAMPERKAAGFASG